MHDHHVAWDKATNDDGKVIVTSPDVHTLHHGLAVGDAVDRPIASLPEESLSNPPNRRHREPAFLDIGIAPIHA